MMNRVTTIIVTIDMVRARTPGVMTGRKVDIKINESPMTQIGTKIEIWIINMYIIHIKVTETTQITTRIPRWVLQTRNITKAHRNIRVPGQTIQGINIIKIQIF